MFAKLANLLHFTYLLILFLAALGFPCCAGFSLVAMSTGYSLVASLVAQWVKNLPAMRETWGRPLGGEDPLEGMATHSSILAWRIPTDRGAWHVIVHGVTKSQT